jgi:trehalose/maltose transport system substrate-binding protein
MRIVSPPKTVAGLTSRLREWDSRLRVLLMFRFGRKIRSLSFIACPMILAAAGVLAATNTLAAGQEPVEITIACGSVGADIEICRKLVDDWSARTGNKVRIFVTPNSTTDQLAMYRLQSGARSSEVDVLMVDVVWLGMVKDHLLDLTPYARGAQQAHFPAIIANNTVNGKLLAMPWFTDAGLLFYRRDLLDKYREKVPVTWNELTAVAQRIQAAERAAGRPDMVGFVFQGKAYEGLTCNAFEWIASSGGGTIVEADGRISVDNPQAARALDLAGSWPGGIAPKNVVSFGEEEARGVFQSGNAVFMRNWSYIWNLSQRADSKIKGKVGVAPLPKGDGGTSVSTLGGWQLAVSKYSQHPREAAELVMYLTGAPVQKQRAVSVGSLPTIPALYRDPDVLKANPYFTTLADAFAQARPRPATVTGDKYNAVSSAFWNAAYATLSGTSSGTASVVRMAKDLKKIRRGEKW